MSNEEDRIVHIQGLTQQIKIEHIYETYSKSGEIERIILGNGEALVFFADEDQAGSSLVYDTIGDLEIESQITSQTTLDNVVQDIDYIAKQKQEDILRAQRYEQEKQLEQQKFQERLIAIQQEKQREEQEQAEEAARQEQLLRETEDLKIKEAEKQEQLLREAEALKQKEAEKQEQILREAEALKKKEAETIAEEIVKAPVAETILDQVAQPDVHQPLPEVQPSQSYAPESPFKASIDSSPSVEETKATQIPTAIIESPVVANVEPPKIQQQEIVQESAGIPSVAAVATPTVKASEAPQIAKEVIPSSQIPAVVNVQATTAPSFGAAQEEKVVVPQPEQTQRQHTEKALTSKDETQSNTSSTTTNSTAAPTSVQPTQSACPFKSSCLATSSNESASCTESSSTLDSIQLLKILKNTTLPARTDPIQNDIFQYIENKNFLIALFGILIAVTFSSAL